MSGQTGALNYNDFNSAVPAADAVTAEETRRFEALPIKDVRAKNVHANIARVNAMREKDKNKNIDRAAAVKSTKRAQRVSFPAVAGAIIVAVLMVFVVLAQIYYNEAVSETVRLNAQLGELSERHRSLELAFVSAIDIREVERFARDELGMTRPDAGQMIFLNSTVRDSAVIVETNEESGMQSFLSFMVSLVGYFR